MALAALAALGSCRENAQRERSSEPVTERPAKAKHGILGQQAPKLGVETWFNLADGAVAPEIAQLRGKVIFLFFYQSW